MGFHYSFLIVLIVGLSLPINKVSEKDVPVRAELENSDEDLEKTLKFACELQYCKEDKV